MFSEEEEEEESGHFFNEYKERGDHLVADGGESLEFLPPNKNCPKVVSFGEDAERYFDPIYEEVDHVDDEEEEEVEDEILGKRDQNINDSISIGNSAENDCGGTRPVIRVQNKSDDLVTKFETHQGTCTLSNKVCIFTLIDRVVFSRQVLGHIHFAFYLQIGEL